MSKPACMNCATRPLCAPHTLEVADIHQIDRMITGRYAIRTGERLRLEEEEGGSVFLVRTGVSKCTYLTADGGECVTGFLDSGDLLTLDRNELHGKVCELVALTPSTVCRLSLAQLRLAALDNPQLQRQLIYLLSREIARQGLAVQLLRHTSAAQRLAHFLVSASWKNAQRGKPDTDFMLPMTRRDLADYLGLSESTTARLYSEFNKLGYIQLHHRHLRILQPEALRKLAGASAFPERQAVATES
ncbi:helix-turn-helix domain-containing protein [Massilia endophytica]|uniref:helix-turn-helix domain-containing protein n=1 Tax=Massilia endophytica TaxID=2899220 RepID=UPI001E61B8DD|nr:helix-turn-helix domain-containing protein [Massilia endophytica]UGQ48566.1 helix-turn-helix domain-containing protein [Massilia endophytica]